MTTEGQQSKQSTRAQQQWRALVRRGGSYARVLQGIREGWAPVNETDAAGFTALMQCCVSGQMVDLLIECATCDVNASAAPDGSTPLLLAARYRNPSTVGALLGRGAVLGHRDVKGASVVHKAAANRDVETLRLLLESGASPATRDRDGRCALGVALLQANEPAALLLLEWLGRTAGQARYDHTDSSYTTDHSGGGGLGAGSARSSTRHSWEAGLAALDDDVIDRILSVGICSSQNGTAAGGSGGRGKARREAFLLGSISRRFRDSCHRWVTMRWTYDEVVNASVPLYYPVGDSATPLQLAMSHRMEAVARELITRSGLLHAADTRAHDTPKSTQSGVGGV